MTYNIRRIMFYISLIVWMSACGGGNSSENNTSWELIADAGKDISLITGHSVQLSGENSLEKSRNESLLYRWSIFQKPQISNAQPPTPIDSVKPHFTPDIAGEYKLQLDVSVANSQQVETSYITLTATEIQELPSVNIDTATEKNVVIDNDVNLSLSKDHIIRADLFYVWQIEGPPSDLAKQSINQSIEQSFSGIGSFQPLTFQTTEVGEYRFTLILQDASKTIISKHEIKIIVGANKINSAPIADAGLDKHVEVGETVSLIGSAFDADNDPLTYEWSFSSIPENSTVSLTNANNASASFIPDMPGIFVVSLKVNDDIVEPENEMLSQYDSIVVTVSEVNQPPVAQLGKNLTGELKVYRRNSVQLIGDQSYDINEQQRLSYTWTLLVKPENSNATISPENSSKANSILIPDIVGIYKVQLEVSDGLLSDIASIDIQVEDRSPNVDIISHDNNVDVSSDCPVRLEGVVIDAEDGNVDESNIHWISNIDGELGNGESVTVTLSPNIHLISLRATDSHGQTSTSTRTLTVLSSTLISGVPVTPSACGDFANEDSTILSGEFVGPPIQGLKYITNTIAGITDENGSFKYRFGEKVYFLVGNNLLGSASGDAEITPIDLVQGAENETNANVTNIIRFLQLVDSDNNPNNGIEISDDVQAVLENVKLDISSPIFPFSTALTDFIRTSNESGLFETSHTLTSAKLARKNLRWFLYGEVPPIEPPLNSQIEIIEDSFRINNPDQKENFFDFDADGFPHIIIGGDHLHHIYRTAQGWQSTTIDKSNDGLENYHVLSMRIDEQGFIHTTFSAAEKYEYLRYYASNRSGKWAIESIEHLDGQVKIDKSGKIHQFGFDMIENQFFHATNLQGNWTSAFLGGDGVEGPPDSPSHMLFKIDNSGHTHVAFVKTTGYDVNFEDTVLKYASNASGEWKVELLADDFSTLPDEVVMDVDSNGIPHILYSDREVIHGSKFCQPSPCDNRNQVRYFTKLNDEWQSEMVVGWDHTSDISLSIENDNSLNFYISAGSTLYSAEKTAGVWSTELITNDMKYGRYFVGYDTVGKQAISYIPQDSQWETNIKYITRIDGIWESETAFASSPVGLFQTSVMDSNDKLHVAYWDAGIKAIKYATNSQGEWNIESVFNEIDIDSKIAIDIDSNNFIHIALVDSNSKTLKYVTNNSGAWASETIGDSTAVYESASLALDADGKPHITYRDAALFSWMYTEKTSGTWTTERIVYYASKDHSFELGVSDSGDRYLCYGVTFGNDKGIQLAYKLKDDKQWQVVQIDSGDVVESYCSLEIDRNNKVHMAYRIDLPDLYSNQLVYRHNVLGTWHSEVVETGFHPGRYTSLTLNNDNNPVITHAESDSKIHYVIKQNDEWITGFLGSAVASGDKIPAFIDSLGRVQATYRDGDLKAVMITDPTLP